MEHLNSVNKSEVNLYWEKSNGEEMRWTVGQSVAFLIIIDDRCDVPWHLVVAHLRASSSS